MRRSERTSRQKAAFLCGYLGRLLGALFREGLTQGASVRFEARAFAIFRALRDACLCLAIGIIVSCGARGVSPGCRW